ncbi:amidohydrolase [Obba rivulosa]|uniref:Amidohydrolase n=1 Tax=Obba rivulosa TaxID=1052685 RepID=A0A8E2DGG5_9APHY|nr:amidohydrolase [Obba rivulosa]
MSSDVQAGCFARLFSSRQHRRDTHAPTNDAPHVCRPSVCPHPSQPQEIPAYAHFTNCLFCEPDGYAFRSDKPPSYSASAPGDLYRPEVLKTIGDSLDQLEPELRKLSLDIAERSSPSISRYAHDTLTNFMVKHGFKVTSHYKGLSTAWRAAYTHVPKRDESTAKRPHRVIGVNAEMDALPGIGHACGHNLIAMAGVGVAIAIKAALQAHDVWGTVVLLGTPAEEGGGGKQILLDRGAYDEMDACIMCHPAAGPDNSTWVAPSLASQPIDIEFFGHGSHAAAAPWEGRNALDAAFLAYSGVSVLRQQILPTHRVHGIVTGRDWAPNVIPDYAKMRWIVRAPTWAELEVLRERVLKCFEAAAHATACKLKIQTGIGYYDLHENDVLGTRDVVYVGNKNADRFVCSTGVCRCRTGTGNVTYALPAIHPVFAIPTEPNGGNHTPQFAKAAVQPEAHAAALKVAKGLAAVGFRFLDDEKFSREVRCAADDPAYFVTDPFQVEDAFEDEVRAKAMV